MRFLDSDLDKEERQQREDGGLQKADEELEKHQEARDTVGGKENRDRDNDRTSENVAEKTE